MQVLPLPQIHLPSAPVLPYINLIVNLPDQQDQPSHLYTSRSINMDQPAVRSNQLDQDLEDEVYINPAFER